MIGKEGRVVDWRGGRDKGGGDGDELGEDRDEEESG